MKQLKTEPVDEAFENLQTELFDESNESEYFRLKSYLLTKLDGYELKRGFKNKTETEKKPAKTKSDSDTKRKSEYKPPQSNKLKKMSDIMFGSND
jgi:hypothetical protein